MIEGDNNLWAALFAPAAGGSTRMCWSEGATDDERDAFDPRERLDGPEQLPPLDRPTIDLEI